MLHNFKDSGFKTPKDYFNNLENRILSEVKLKDGATQTGFKLPDAYLDTLEDDILNKVILEKRPKVIKLVSKRNLVYMSSIAAAILLLFNLSIFDSKPTFDSLDTETVENYIIDEGLDSYEIAALLTNEELDDINFVKQELNDESVELYILEHLDIEQLIIE